jgi:hypothetical protein
MCTIFPLASSRSEHVVAVEFGHGSFCALTCKPLPLPVPPPPPPPPDAVTVAVCAESADADPDAFDAVTTERTVSPTSPAASVYVDDDAPVIFEQPDEHRCH